MVTNGLIASTIDDALAIEARAMMTEARKKGGEVAIRNRLHAIASRSHHEGAKKSSDYHVRRSIDNAARVRDQVVCCFLAEYEDHARTNSLHGIWTFNHFTLGKIVEVLTEAGYHGGGRRPQPATGE